MECLSCKNNVRTYERHCPVCGADAGYPNVRAATQPDEIGALERRLQTAQDEANAQGTAEALSLFRASVRQSRAVLCQSLHQVLALVSTDNELYASFYAQRRAGSRRPEDSPIDRERLIADSLLFPNYREEIRFAALSLTGDGVRYYGNCSIVLSDFAIASRATVFEQNSLEFCRAHKLGLGTPLPPGCRATWPDRDKLAGAKLYTCLGPDSNEATFKRILLTHDQEAGAEFIEVHIYGSLHRRSFDRITVPEPLTPGDEALVLELERRVGEVGTEVSRRHGF
jgi:hypothetical protein